MIFGAHSLAPATPRQGTEKFDSSNLSLEWGKFRGNYSCVLPNFVRKFAAEIFPGQWGEEEEEREGGRLGRMRGGEERGGRRTKSECRFPLRKIYQTELFTRFRCGKKFSQTESVAEFRCGKKRVENRKYPTIGRF